MKGLRQVKLDRYGYTKEGSYFGHYMPLWESDDFGLFRAKDRQAAVEKVKGWQAATGKGKKSNV